MCRCECQCYSVLLFLLISNSKQLHFVKIITFELYVNPLNQDSINAYVSSYLLVHKNIIYRYPVGWNSSKSYFYEYVHFRNKYIAVHEARSVQWLAPKQLMHRIKLACTPKKIYKKLLESEQQFEYNIWKRLTDQKVQEDMPMVMML